VCSRFGFALLLTVVLTVVSPAQQGNSDVVVQGASVNDGYGSWPTCGVDGQIYRSPSGGRLTSVMRVSRDGSTLLFNLPEGMAAGPIAPAGTGLNILSSFYSTAERRLSLQMLHFDSRADPLAQHEVTMPLQSTMAMVAMPSGRTIIAGSHWKDPGNPEDRTYGFVILDEDDKLERSVDLPLPPGGGGWTFATPHIAAGNGVAYVMLHSHEPPQTAIAAISEKGNQILNIKVIAAPPNTETRQHEQWVFGPGVAVEMYHYTNERPHVTGRFDEYDLKTGEKIATKSATPTGFQFGCYMGDEVSMLAHSAHVDPARNLSPDTLRLVTTKLQ
jgi:hypothetical protein